MKLVQINVHALEDAIKLVAGTVGAQLIDATYKAIDAAEQRGFAQAHSKGFEGIAQDRYDEGYDDGYPDGFQDGSDAAVGPCEYQEALQMACAALDDELDGTKVNARVEGSDWDDLLDNTHYDIYHQRFHRPGSEG